MKKFLLSFLIFLFICSISGASYIYPSDHTTGRAMFLWDKDSIDEPSEVEALVSFCEDNKINQVLVSVYSWIGRYSWSSSKVEALQHLIGSLHASGISVFALSGNYDWTEKQNWVRRTVLEPVRQYNSQSTAMQKFDGFIYDVEYYVTDNNPQLHVPLMCNLIKDTKKILDMPVGMWAPWWQITDDRSTGLVTYDGVTAPEGIHWMRVVDHMFVGAYSDKAESVSGQQGQISMMRDWLSYCDTSSRRVAIWATSETKNLGSDWQSYYEEDKAYMETQHDLIAEEFLNEDNSGSTCFYGQAIHHYDTYRVMD